MLLVAIAVCVRYHYHEVALFEVLKLAVCFAKGKPPSPAAVAFVFKNAQLIHSVLH